MDLKNQIINYFVVVNSADNTIVRVVRSPITINSKIAKSLIMKQFNEVSPLTKILHVCFDVDSKIIYLPNATEFGKDTVSGLLGAVKLRISREFECGYSLRSPIEGSPFSSLRYRYIKGFQQAYRTIQDQFKGITFDNLPVIEVNLARMPHTARSLPSRYINNKEFIGGYVSTSDCNFVSFVEEYDINGRKREKAVLLLSQKTPFILIDISQTTKRTTPTAMDKELVILNGYRDHLCALNAITDKDSVASFADLYSIKRHLYLGWPFEEICSLMLRDKISNLGELIKAISLLIKAAKSLESDGYDNPANYPYYMTFDIDSSFPLGFSSAIVDGKINIDRQYAGFTVVDYDNSKSAIIIRSPVFISPTICKEILKSKSAPFICKYNPISKSIDVKCGKTSECQKSKIRSMIKTGLNVSEKLLFKYDVKASGVSAVNSNIYAVRKISNYYYACDFLKALCKQTNVAFKDIEVVVGPIGDIMGKGTGGGFMGERAFMDKKVELPLKLDKDTFVSPPAIIINSITYPSYADQTEILIHEYVHYLFEINNFAYENLYNKEKGKGYKYWHLYFADPSEKVAHINQIKFEFLVGKSYDEIIRNKVGGEITEYNYPIAIRFSQLVTEAANQTEKEYE